MLFKLRRLLPCWVGTVDFNVDLPDDDLVQVMMTVCCEYSYYETLLVAKEVCNIHTCMHNTLVLCNLIDFPKV